jgi:hypothetical protein
MTLLPSTVQDCVVRDAAAEDVEALLALHHEGFDSNWTAAAWQHRYPSGTRARSRVVGAFDRGGRCLAAFGGVLLRCRIDGAPALACRGGDVVVAPQLRTSPAGARLLLRVCSAFFGGFGDREIALVFGFPGPGLTRTLVGHCRFEVLADVVWLCRPAIGCGGGVAAWSAAVEATLPTDLDGLLARIGANGDWGLVRDVGYLQWRYLDNPLGRYRIVTARDGGGRLGGVAVVRCDGPQPDAVVIVEWLVGDGAVGDVTSALLAAIGAVAVAAQRTVIVLCVAGSDPEFARLQRHHGFQAAVSPYQFLFRSYRRPVTRGNLFAHWRFSAGDLDFL